MAKVKKMAFGGMGSRPPMGPSRGVLGGNQAPAGANLMQKYNGVPAGANLMQKYNGTPSAPPSAPPAIKMLGMKNGGSASSRADGCAMRGKTKGRMV